MPPQEIARQWFIPGDGIDRHVISADIQRYLGNDATVRPGQGTGENQGVQGYWIKAYRNLTSAMISDLRADSARWRQEQRATGTREPYVGSRTYEASSASSAARANQRRDADSPSLEGPYGVPPQSRQGRNQVDAMQIDPPVARSDGRYGQPQPPSRGYQQDGGAYPPQGRDRYPESSRPPYQQDQPMADAYGRPPVTSSYGQDSRYATSYPQTDGAPPGYIREGNYYVPITSSYGQPSIMAPTRPEPQQYPAGPYGQPQPPMGRDPREQRDPRDPRYGQSDYNDPRYAYPSPATTVSSVAPRDREPISSPQQPSPFGTAPPQYDRYGQPVQNPQGLYGASEPGYPPTRDSNYGRERQPAAPPAPDRDRDARRRRLH